MRSSPPSPAATFRHWALADAVPTELTHETSTFLLRSWSREHLDLELSATHFGFVFSGDNILRRESAEFPLLPGMYFSVPGAARMAAMGDGFVISQFDYTGLFQLGGPIERQGRLQYIDGCSDTLLISPVIRGEACLNLLYLPPQTKQTAHTHPSFRAGIIVSGHGTCRLRHHCVALQPGVMFVIEREGLHSFHTDEESLSVIAFHPDSDFGPWHDDHPMVNRTMVNGVSAAQLSPRQRGIDGGTP